MAAPDIKFQISPFSSTRFVNENITRDPSFNTRPIDDLVDGLSYKQPVQQNDSNFRVYLMSVYNDVALALFTCDDKFVKNVAFTPGPIVTGAAFLIYTAVVDFTDVVIGAYYLKLTYTDADDVVQDIRSAPLDVDDVHEGTLAYDYTNTINDKGVIFVNDDSSLVVFRHRVHASIDEYQPLSNDVTYIDQYEDVDVLNNVPYDNHKNYIGTTCLGGIPDWVIKKMNLIFTLNKVQIDGQLSARVDGSKFTPTRPDFGYMVNGVLIRPTFWSIDIQPNDNFFQGKLTTGDIPNQDIIVVKQPKIFDNVGADFSISGWFKDDWNLIRIVVINKNQDVFTLKLGTTAGDNDIGEIEFVADPETEIVPLTGSKDIGHPFTGATEVFISGVNGTNLKITFDSNWYTAPPVNPPANGSGGFVKGVLYTYYERAVGDFALDWDAADGLGKRDFIGCSLAGKNGVPDRAGKYSRGWDITQPTERGQDVGAPANLIAIERVNLPAEGVALFDASVNLTRGDIITEDSNVARAGNAPTGQIFNYEMLKGRPGTEPTLGLSAKLGSGDEIDITPDSVNDVLFGFIGT